MNINKNVAFLIATIYMCIYSRSQSAPYSQRYLQFVRTHVDEITCLKRHNYFIQLSARAQQKLAQI